MENEQQTQPTPQVEKEKAGWVGILTSLVVPIIGIILYFTRQKTCLNPRAYILAANVGALIGTAYIVVQALHGKPVGSLLPLYMFIIAVLVLLYDMRKKR